MLVGIHQLHYLPWLRYFDKFQRADVFIVLDDIQFNKNGWQNRNKIKGASGPILLTLPVQAKAAQHLHEVRVDNGSNWRKKHWASIQQSYRKALFFEAYAPSIEAAYGREWDSLNDINRHMLEFYVDALRIDTPLVYSSDLRVPGIATERLVNLIKAVNGTAYYTGAYALDTYLDADHLERENIALEIQDWRAPAYPQLYGEFIPDLSIIDLLMNCGPESLEVLCAQPT